MRDNPEGGELELAEYIRWTCKKNFPSVLSCIGTVRRQKKTVTMAATSGQYTMGGTRKGQFLCGNQENLAEEGVVRINKRKELGQRLPHQETWGRA